MGASGHRIYCYKLTTDSGGAPCVDGGQLLSLAICKPMIRQTCSQGSYIIGFGGKGLRERLLYVAKITGIAENYYRSRKYAGRGDQIYRWDGTAKAYSIKKGARFHRAGDQILRDLGQATAYDRNRVLLSNDFSYWGEAGTTDYKGRYPRIKDLVENMVQGHRAKYSEDLYSELVKLTELALATPGVHGKPTHHEESDRVCNRDRGGSVEVGGPECAV